MLQHETCIILYDEGLPGRLGVPRTWRERIGGDGRDEVGEKRQGQTPSASHSHREQKKKYLKANK